MFWWMIPTINHYCNHLRGHFLCWPKTGLYMIIAKHSLDHPHVYVVCGLCMWSIVSLSSVDLVQKPGIVGIHGCLRHIQHCSWGNQMCLTTLPQCQHVRKAHLKYISIMYKLYTYVCHHVGSDFEDPRNIDCNHEAVQTQRQWQRSQRNNPQPAWISSTSWPTISLEKSTNLGNLWILMVANSDELIWIWIPPASKWLPFSQHILFQSSNWEVSSYHIPTWPWRCIIHPQCHTAKLQEIDVRVPGIHPTWRAHSWWKDVP